MRKDKGGGMIALDFESTVPLYQQIYESIRADIVSRSLPAGSRLSAIRRLAEDLQVARNTVEAAYMQLAAEGYVTSRAGSGYVVEDLDFDSLGEPDAAAHRAHNRAMRAIASPDRFSDEPFHRKEAFTYDFTYGNRPQGSFPASIWCALTDEALLSAGNKASGYGYGLGEPGLRRQIAQRVHVARGVNCTAEQVIIQPGTQAALSNLLTLFDPSRDKVAIEEPGYDGVASVFRNRGFSLAPLPVYALDAEERRNAAFCRALDESGAALAFCTPSNQFPTGITMPLSCRIHAIEWARRERAYILEDDYCREFRYESRPIPSLQSLDNHDRVVYMGTLSKVLSPALRMSYLVLPPALLERWHETFANYYCPVPWLSQETLRLFMEKGHWDRYTRKTMTAYRKRRNTLMESLEREMGGRVDVLGGTAGLHLLVRTRDSRGQKELIEAAKTRDVRVYATEKYWLGQPHSMQDYVLVGFSSIECDLIPEGIRRLREAWF